MLRVDGCFAAACFDDEFRFLLTMSECLASVVAGGLLAPRWRLPGNYACGVPKVEPSSRQRWRRQRVHSRPSGDFVEMQQQVGGVFIDAQRA